MNIKATARAAKLRTAFAGILCQTSLSITGILIASHCFAQQQAATADSILEFRGLRFDPLEADSGEDFVALLDIDEALLFRPPEDADVPYWQILQFSRPVTQADQSSIREQIGAELQLTMYLGGGWIEHVSRNAVDSLRTNGILRAAVPYHPAFKLNPQLRSLVPLSREFLTQQRRELPDLIFEAVLFPNVTRREAAQVAADIGDRGGTNIITQNAVTGPGNRLIRAATVTFTLEEQSDLIEIVRLDDVSFIELDDEMISDNGDTAHLTQSGDLSSGPVWDVGLHGEGQVIGIIDDGSPDISHCLLSDPNVALPGMSHRKIVQLRDASGISSSGGSHATRVAGSAAADHAAMPGWHPQRGSAWGARLALGNWHDFYTFDAIQQCRARRSNAPRCRQEESSLSTFAEELIEASDYAFIHSNSWHDGFDKAGYSQHAVEADSFTRALEDHLVIGSAGKNWLVWGPPAIAKNTLAVSAGQKDPYPMQWGNGFDNPVPSGRIKPDVVVVGCGIRTAETGSACGITDPLNCGTSYAAPHAAGAAAIVRQYFTEGWYPSGTKTSADSRSPSAALLKAMLINSARPLQDQSEFPSIREGWGVVLLDGVLYFEGGNRRLWVSDIRNADTAPIKALNIGEQHEYNLDMTGTGEPLKVTLVWTDHPSEPFNGILRNDLDLEVVDPNDNLHLGNDFPDADPAFATNGMRDSINNVEQVLIDSPATGLWTIRVKGTKVTGNEMQGYALVTTGASFEVTVAAVP